MVWLLGLTVVILSVIAVFGLSPKETSYKNNVKWLNSPNGIRFDRYGMAYTDLVPDFEEDMFGKNGFSIEMAFKPESYSEEGFRIILLLHGGNDTDQLLIGQWRSSIIVMNGDDYNHGRRIKRLMVKTNTALEQIRFITITTSPLGSKVYFDGKLMGNRKDLVLKMPKDKVRLTLGNSVYGRHAWEGDIYGMSCYRHKLTGKEAKAHFNEWQQTRSFSFAKKSSPLILYLFEEKADGRIENHGSTNYPLYIPSRIRALKPAFFPLQWNKTKLNYNFLKDSLLNLFGFMPLGIILVATFQRAGGPFRDHPILMTLAVGFTVSFCIEFAQAWMPSRNSDMMDLVLNSLGTWIGALGFHFYATAGNNRVDADATG